ncbi:hypothetical protein [Streptomyces camelliae]|uniref:Lipoprotein n=1 Tax=Streptomyces camelliae TaxID=3004093 RepID=A0ABY7NW57_9ACTN|nr:hypothetical protein [Streptomyces sp. HUAS 2-6]WBO62407.1 hypothetical protein O1G22_06025 [Streptomyces sp. HUAS 2-6]
MRAIRVASAALLGAGTLALALGASAALAGDDHDGTPFGFRVAPSAITAGNRVRLQVDRDGGGCRGTATVSSGVFDTLRIPPERSSATAVVDRNARPGAAHSVTFRCDGASGATDLTIADGREGDQRDQPYDQRYAPLPPVQHGVRAGAGGSVGGFDVKEIGLGALLIAGSLGTAYRLARRRAHEDGL